MGDHRGVGADVGAHHHVPLEPVPVRTHFRQLQPGGQRAEGAVPIGDKARHSRTRAQSSQPSYYADGRSGTSCGPAVFSRNADTDEIRLPPLPLNMLHGRRRAIPLHERRRVLSGDIRTVSSIRKRRCPVMSLTVQKALALPPLTLGTVVAGAGGLDREINSVTVQEIINEDLISVKFLTAGVFIVSSLYAIAEDTDTQVSLIRRLDDCQVSALALFNVGPVMPQISERLIAVCDELNFPLIKMPIHVSYYEVLTAIIDKLLAHKVHTLEGIIQVYEAFNTQLMNIEEDYSSLLAMLGNMIGAPLAFFNHNQKCIYSSWGRESDALLKEIFCQSRSLFSNLSDIPKTPVPLTVAGKQYLVRPVHSNNTYYGVLIIETSEYPLTGLMNFYIKQTCQALCIILLNSERQDKYRKRLRYEYLYDLLLGNLGDRMQILSQGRSLDYQIAGVDRVLVVSPTGCEQSSGFQPLQRLEAQIPHVFPSSIPIIMTEPLELVLLSTGKKPKDLAYMGRWISSLLLSENMESLVGVSSSCGGPEKIAACYQEAQQAVRISRQLFSQSSLPYVFYDDVKIFALLQSSIKRKKAAEVVEELMGSVEQYDRINNSQLGETFFQLLVNNVSTAQVAQQMFLHKNTVLQRKGKIASFYARDPFEGPNHLQYELAVILKRLFEL